VAIELRPVRPAGWWFDAVLLLALAGLTLALARGALLDLDLAVRDWVDAHRPPAAYWIARALNYLGQGGLVLVPVSTILAITLAWRTRSPRPFLVVVGAFLLTGVTIGPLKFWLDRGYPHNTELAHPEELFSDPVNGTAYPSGHVANAIVWYGVIALLLHAVLAAYGRPPLAPASDRLIRVLPPVIVFCSTTYLGYHWITDSVAGLLLGLLLDRILSRTPWDDLPYLGRQAGLS
jgi:membrane-associated phospholipid phosphatase